MSRPSWDKYFMDQCELVASRSTCNRKHVGAVIVIDKRIVSSGYNGSLPGEPHCDDPPFFIQCKHCQNKLEITESEAEAYTQGTLRVVCSTDNVTNIACLGYPLELKHGGHDIENNGCQRTVHSEQNAVAQAARLGISINGATIYCNTLPCWNCYKIIASSGITEIVYRDTYGIASANRVLSSGAVKLRKFAED